MLHASSTIPLKRNDEEPHSASEAITHTTPKNVLCSVRRSMCNLALSQWHGEKKNGWRVRQTNQQTNQGVAMPLNEHLLAFNLHKAEAIANDANEFTFRGNTYVAGEWANGVKVFRRKDSAYRGARRRRGSRRKSRRRSR